MRHAARRDENEGEVVAALQAAGATVAKLSGDGIPDLLVEARGVLYLVEVKDKRIGYVHTRPRGKHDDPDPRYRELTPTQVKWWRRWEAAGGRAPVIVHGPEEALAAIGATTRDTDLPPELLPDALALHLQHKPRC